jgi:putative redox protein
MDVVSLLEKMRVEIEDFKIVVTGELTDEHPKYYHKIHITYQFKGKDIHRGKVEKAVNLSQDKYCGVSYMLKQAAEITYNIDYV